MVGPPARTAHESAIDLVDAAGVFLLEPRISTGGRSHGAGVHPRPFGKSRVDKCFSTNMHSTPKCLIPANANKTVQESCSRQLASTAHNRAVHALTRSFFVPGVGFEPT